MKREDIYADIALDVETKFDTSNYDTSKGINKKVIGFMKDKLGGRIMKEFTALIPKMYIYFTDDGHVDKKAMDTKKFVIKKDIKVQDHKDSLEN